MKNPRGGVTLIADDTLTNLGNPKGGVILIVDDTPTNLGMLCDFLTDSGFEVLVAIDGESAIEQAVYAQPHLILLDVLMPRIDGFETCRRLKANPSTQDIPVIFMTALGETADKVRGFKVGALDYVTKPIQPEEVLARITNHLTIQNLQKELQKQNLQLQQEVKDRQQAEELVRQQAQREQLLSEISQRIRQSLNLEEILSTTVSEVRQFLQTDRVLIYRFFDDWSGAVVVESVSTEELSIQDTTIIDSCFGEAYIQLYQQGRIRVVEDIYTAGLTPCHVDFLANFKVRANLVVPILQEERLWGLLVAHQCYEPRQWQQLDVDLLKALSTPIAIAIQQGQLHQRLRRQNQVLVALAKSRTVNYGDLNSTLRQVTEAAAQTLEISRVSVWLYSPDHSKIHCLDLFERSANRHTDGMALTAVDYPAYFKALEQEPTITVPDADTNPISLELQAPYLPYGYTVVSPYGMTAILTAPIRVGGQIVGVVCYEHTDLSRQWTLDEQNFAGSLADVVSLSLEARERQRAEEKIRLLQTITQAISESQDFHSALEVTLCQVCETIGWNFGAVWIPHSDGTVLESSPAWYASTHPGGATLSALENFRQHSKRLQFAPDQGLPGRVWSSKQPEWIQDVAIEPEAVFVGSKMVLESGLTSCLGIPIVVNDQVLAVFVFFTFEAREQDQRLIELVWAVGTQLGSVIQRKAAEEALRLAEQRYHSADIVGFTEFSAKTSPKELVIALNLIFSKFDQLAQRHGLEKIKTIGDSYMVVAGLPTPHPDHASAIAEMALDMQAEMVRVSEETGEAFRLRIGINSGPVVAGVIGIKKFTYDLWGDTVNVASRMESQGVDGAIQVTAATYELLRDKYLLEERGVISVKGKGDMTTYLLTGRQFDKPLV